MILAEMRILNSKCETKCSCHRLNIVKANLEQHNVYAQRPFDLDSTYWIFHVNDWWGCVSTHTNLSCSRLPFYGSFYWQRSYFVGISTVYTTNDPCHTKMKTWKNDMPCMKKTIYARTIDNQHCHLFIYVIIVRIFHTFQIAIAMKTLHVL
jgi:hypothetical protein